MNASINNFALANPSLCQAVPTVKSHESLVESQGCGVFISPDRDLLTNVHVIGDSSPEDDEQMEKFVQEKGRDDLPIDAILVDFNGPIILAQTLSNIPANQTQTATQTTLMERLAENPTGAYQDDEDGRHITP